MGRQYDWRFKCPHCGRPYAKKTLWVRHIKACEASQPCRVRFSLAENGPYHPCSLPKGHAGTHHD